jgi:KH/beta-lactamase-domain protein
MNPIFDEIFRTVPKEKISDAVFEGANIVLYTKDREFIFNSSELIRTAVMDVKKRIELRPDPALLVDQERAEEIIRSIVPKEAGLDQVLFDPERSLVTIEVDNPAMLAGRNNDIVLEIKQQTFWAPTVRRVPPLRSKIIEGIRTVLYQNSDYRRKFLDRTGRRVYDGWMRGRKHEWVRLTYLGSGRQVGRSCILLQTQESRILLDCGIDVSTDTDDAYPYLDAPEFKIDELDAVILSHAHVDHSAFIPYLYKYGYRGPVYCTAPTRDISALMQLDTVKIQRNEHHEPIYGEEEVKEFVKHSIILDYEEVTDITPDVRITFHNSGHIIGGAMVHLHIGNGLHNILYTGDIKYVKTSLLSPAVTRFPRLETLMLEATYGAKDNLSPPPAEQDELFASTCREVFKRGGKLLMPVLGSGRGQEVLVIIDRMIRNGLIDPVPIYIDGLVWDITAIYTAYPEFLNADIRQQIFHKDNNPFLADWVKRVGSQTERRQVIESGEPCIILATSGMLNGGASVEYFKNLAEQEKNAIMFSSYLAPGSLAKRVWSGETAFAFRKGSGQEILQCRMEVHKLDVSGHADRKELMSFVNHLNPKPRKIILNHGESSRCLDLASALHKQFRVETVCPRNLEAIRLR